MSSKIINLYCAKEKHSWLSYYNHKLSWWLSHPHVHVSSQLLLPLKNLRVAAPAVDVAMPTESCKAESVGHKLDPLPACPWSSLEHQPVKNAEVACNSKEEHHLQLEDSQLLGSMQVLHPSNPPLEQYQPENQIYQSL